MKKVVVFGVGQYLKRVIMRDMLAEYDIIAFCDNDKNKWGSTYNGVEIIAPQNLMDYQFDEILLCTKKYNLEIKEQLVKLYAIPIDKIITIAIPENKYEAELDFWKVRYQEEKLEFKNDFYKDFMLSIAEESSDEFWKNKIVADFGCGPRGSLKWTNTPTMKIGIDVLVPEYLKKFGDNMITHEMVYVTSSEQYIPLPDESVDVLVTTNALDHVRDLESMCKELIRILKHNGTLLASFNINEPKTETVPYTLTVSLLEDMLLKYFNISTYRLAYADEKDAYLNVKNNRLIEKIEEDRRGVLWVRATKNQNYYFK
ncbi:MAG: methyltransferase domain-containing protein [Lachnospiraceae bacterium]|nr:methyltransferase domain-containing protein [Lachnospiraceae bacterium]